MSLASVNGLEWLVVDCGGPGKQSGLRGLHGRSHDTTAGMILDTNCANGKADLSSTALPSSTQIHGYPSLQDH
jgi:hypothetical protein